MSASLLYRGVGSRRRERLPASRTVTTCWHTGTLAPLWSQCCPCKCITSTIRSQPGNRPNRVHGEAFDANPTLNYCCWTGMRSDAPLPFKLYCVNSGHKTGSSSLPGRARAASRRKQLVVRLHRTSLASAILEISGPGRNMHQGLKPKVGGLNLRRAVQAADVITAPHDAPQRHSAMKDTAAKV